MTGLDRSVRRRIHGTMFRLPLMITCNEFEDFILAYLEGELPRKQKLIFRMHLGVCRECREYLKAYRAALDLAVSSSRAETSLLPGEVPPDLVEAVLAARDA